MMRPGAPRLVLASASSARAAVLRRAGLAFEVRPASVDEAAVKASMQAEGEDAAACALTLSALKAGRVREPGAVVIGADQLLVCDGEWFDKPPDLAAARRQLERLRGREHRLVTAAVVQRDGQTIWQHVATPALTMRRFGDEFLDRYLQEEGEALLSSVGAYRIEGLGAQLFERVEGEHAAIQGVPLLALLAFLREHGVLLR